MSSRTVLILLTVSLGPLGFHSQPPLGSSTHFVDPEPMPHGLAFCNSSTLFQALISVSFMYFCIINYHKSDWLKRATVPPLALQFLQNGNLGRAQMASFGSESHAVEAKSCWGWDHSWPFQQVVVRIKRDVHKVFLVLCLSCHQCSK